MTEPSDLAFAIQLYHEHAMRVWDDEAVWNEEAARTACRPLAWPRPVEGTQYQRLLAILFNADVDIVLVLLRQQGRTHSPDWPPDVRDPKMQTVLRVMQRSLEEGERAMRNIVGGERVTGRRDYINRTNEQLAAEALKAARALQLTRDEAFELVGLPRRQGFRAVKRSHRKK